jgi:hypothetical protein
LPGHVVLVIEFDGKGAIFEYCCSSRVIVTHL